MGIIKYFKKSLFCIFICSFILINLESFVYSRHIIKEYISVKWWILPIYAVSDSGEKDFVLKKEDIKLLINGKEIKEFILFKSTNVAEEKDKGSLNKIDKNSKRNNINHIVFLLFDNMLTDPLIFMRGKSIASKIVDSASEGTDFVLLSLENGSGIKYHYGPGNDKKKIKRILKRKMPPRKVRKRHLGNSDIDYNDISYLNDTYAEGIQHSGERKKWEKIYAKIAMKNYLKSLISLKYILKFTMKKSLFFFSSGISKGLFSKNSISGGDKIIGSAPVDSFPYWMLENAAKVINRSGVLFFIINPEGTRILSSDINSGEEALRSLSIRSGGKYLEGTKDEIVKGVNRIVKNFYTVSFPEQKNFKGDSIKIKLISKRKDIKIYSPRVLSPDKNYGNMNKFEREMLVVDIIAGGFWSKTRIEIKKVKLKENAGSVFSNKYRWKDCELSRGQYADIFIVYTKNGKKEIKMKKEHIRFSGGDFLIEVKELKGYKTNIIIIDRFKNRAYISLI